MIYTKFFRCLLRLINRLCDAVLGFIAKTVMIALIAAASLQPAFAQPAFAASPPVLMVLGALFLPRLIRLGRTTPETVP